MILKSINPFTGIMIEEFSEYTDEKINRILIQSEQAFEKWKRTDFDKRKTLMLNVADMLKKNLKIYSADITSEMGKPITESIAEVEKCSWVCKYYAENAENFLKSDKADIDQDKSFIYYEPLGSILGIMPWNFPFWQVFRFAVPTLMAGNTVLLKHASNVQICARHIENIFTGAGFPPSVFNNLVVGSSRVESIIRHKTVKAVSLTGSESAGRQVAEAAGKMLKKSLLELGGSNAFIVLDDADLVKASETGIKARFQNAGQSCIAAKRFIIDRKVSDEFIRLFIRLMKNLKIGDPGNRDTELGPLSSIRQAELVEDQVRRSVEMGAEIIMGGKREKANYEPTLVINVVPGMPLFDEEVFGPVVPVTVAKDTDEAVELANKTNFGLGVSVFTTDLIKADRLIHEFRDGAVFVNSMVKSDPRLPFGGTRNSGYGRELGIYGIKEFVNIKTVYFKTQDH